MNLPFNNLILNRILDFNYFFKLSNMSSREEVLSFAAV